MRLIDADEQIRILESIKKKAVSNGNEVVFRVNNVIKFFNDSTTAYDIDKVIEELEERNKEYNSGLRLHGKPEEMRTDEAIEIVKQGCASDDVCEWKLDGVYLHSPHKPLVSCVTDEGYRYYYCPVCGKKIKVVE